MYWEKKQLKAHLYAWNIFKFADIFQLRKLACGQKLTFSMSAFLISSLVFTFFLLKTRLRYSQILYIFVNTDSKLNEI